MALRTLLLISLLGGAPAWSGTHEEGELSRIIDDLESLAERQVWNGVDRRYEQIMALEGVTVPREIHLTAAHAARSMGDMHATYLRLERAAKQQRTEEIDAWMREIQEDYARVELVLEPARSVELEAEAMPFAPDQRQQVERAIEAMKQDGYFLGMLPEGSYFMGGERFEVIAGVDTRVDLSLKELRLQKRKKDEEPEAGIEVQ